MFVTVLDDSRLGRLTTRLGVSFPSEMILVEELWKEDFKKLSAIPSFSSCGRMEEE